MENEFDMQILKKTGRQSMQISQNEDNDCRESDFRERMLANNRITGLLEFDIVETDGKKTRLQSGMEL